MKYPLQLTVCLFTIAIEQAAVCLLQNTLESPVLTIIRLAYSLVIFPFFVSAVFFRFGKDCGRRELISAFGAVLLQIITPFILNTSFLRGLFTNSDNVYYFIHILLIFPLLPLGIVSICFLRRKR